MWAGRQIHRLVIRSNAFWHGHRFKRRLFVLWSARALACTVRRLAERREISGGGAGNSTRGARAPQQIVMHRFFHAPHRRATMIGETIERPEFSESAPL